MEELKAKIAELQKALEASFDAAQNDELVKADDEFYQLSLEEERAFRAPHNPSNFHPEDYEVVEYLDNQPPRLASFCAPLSSFSDHQRSVEAHQRMMDAWRKEMDFFFPNRREHKPSIHQCTHCGNTRVRYIVACLHKPSGQHVVFGSDCVERLGFANQSSFKAAQIRSRAEAGNARMAAFVARQKFLAANPHVAAAINDLTSNVELHKRNNFAHDILAKFNKYGNMSEPQQYHFVKSLERDHEFAARRAAEDAVPKGEFPSGRIQFTGEVISVKQQESDFGIQMKCLLKIISEVGTGCKVWMTLPSGAGDVARGDRIVVKAGLEVSKDDKHFGFGKRPHFVSKIENTPAVAA
jgi:hypothetical protein